MGLSKVWVFGEATEGKVATISLEMLAKARELSDNVEVVYGIKSRKVQQHESPGLNPVLKSSMWALAYDLVRQLRQVRPMPKLDSRKQAPSTCQVCPLIPLYFVVTVPLFCPHNTRTPLV